MFKGIIKEKIGTNSCFEFIAKMMNVKSIFLVDSTVISLPKNAAEKFPSVTGGVSPASVKVHVFFDILRYCINFINITAGTFYDRHGIKDLVKFSVGNLLIFDLGYYDHSLFAAINANLGFFLSRIRQDATVVAVMSAENTQWIGKNILDITNFLGNIIEFTGTFYVNQKISDQYRAMGFWNKEENHYHWYFTNLKDNVASELMYDLYRIRWQIELLFKSLKGALAMEKITTGNENIIQVLIFAGMSFFFISIRN